MSNNLYIYISLLNLIELWEGRVKEAETESYRVYAQGAVFALNELKNRIDKEV